MKLPKLNKWEAVRVRWIDSTGGEHGWHDVTDEETRVTGCVSVGMVHSQTKERLTLVLSRETTFGHVDGTISIPTAAIRTFQRLRNASR